MNFEDLTPEQREMAKSCKTPEEFLELAREFGCALSEEETKAAFENRAEMARCLRTPELEQQCILGGDKHPSAYVDVNGPAQMFEKFYETYDVKEGDGMYLAPEDRIALW